jgi:hypothetical protein
MGLSYLAWDYFCDGNKVLKSYRRHKKNLSTENEPISASFSNGILQYPPIMPIGARKA